MLDTDRRIAYKPWVPVPITEYFSSHGQRAIRAASVLEKAGIRTVGELLVRTREELISAPGIGYGTVKTAREVLAEDALYLREMWRPRLDAILYLYVSPHRAPASIVLPLRCNPAEVLARAQVVTVGDYRSIWPEEIEKWHHDGTPVFTPEEFTKTMTILSALEASSAFGTTRKF